jgi:hypothetical protein
MTLSDPQTPGPADQGPVATAAPAKPRRTFSRKILTIVSGAALIIGLVLGGGVGVVIGAIVTGDHTSDSSTMPGRGASPFGDGQLPDRGDSTTPDSQTTPPVTDDSSTSS